MKAKDLAMVLLQHPDAEVIFWDGEDNWEVDEVELDAINGIEFVISSTSQEK